MKKTLSLILSLAMVLSVLVAIPVANVNADEAKVVSGLINNSHAELNIKTPIANVQKVSDFSTGLTGSALFDVTELENVETTLSSCLSNAVLPTFSVDTAEEADALLAAMKATGCTDANVITAYPALAEYIRKQNVNIHTGIILSDVLDYGKTTLTAKEANDIRTMVRSAPATFCVIDSDNASRELIYSLRALSVAVWVNITAKADTNRFNVEVINAVAAGANGVISESSASVNALINKHFVANTLAHTPLIVGHKGNHGIVAGNTMASFESALNNGADAIELDVVFTKDNKVVVAHGPTIDKDTNATTATYYTDLTYEQTQQYYALNKDGSTSNYKLSLFSDVLKRFKGEDIIIFLEFKTGNADNVKTTMDLVKAEGMENQVVVIAFGANHLDYSQENITGMSTAYLWALAGINKVANMTQALTELAAPLKTAQQHNSIVSPSYGAIGPSGNYFSQALVDRGMTSWPWTSELTNSRTPVELGFFSGCDGVTTDDAQWSKDMVQYMTASNIKLSLNASVSNNIASIFTYGGKETKLSASDVIYSVISGEKYIEIKDGKITGKQDGVAYVIFGYKAKTTNGSEYVVYTQPIEISVGSGAAEKINHVAIDKAVTDSTNDIPLGNVTPSAAGFRFGYVLNDGIAEGSVNPTDYTWYTFMDAWNATGNKTGSVTIDLGGNYKLSEIKLHLANSNQTFGNGTISATEPEYVKVMVSQDGVDFPKSYDITTKSDENIVYWSGVTATDTVRYIKVEIKIGSGRYALIDEIAVFGTATDKPADPIIPDIPDVPEFDTVDHIAVGKDAVDASGQVPLGYVNPSAAGFQFGYALTDGKAYNEVNPLNKTWFTFMDAWNATTSKTGSVTIDLGANYDLTQVKLHLANFNGPAGKGTLSAVPPEYVKVMVSLDGEKFTSYNANVNTAESIIYWSNVQLEETARYIKVEVKVGANGRYALIDEIAVYGTVNNTPTYNVSFDANGGEGKLDGFENIMAGSVIILPECTFTAPEGMQFKAWNVNGTEMNAGENITVNGNITVSAVWEEIPVTTVDRLLGDVNNDGVVDKKDYAALKRFCFETMQLDDNALLAADVNQDGEVDKKDYAALKRACFGTIVITPEYIQVPAE